MKPNTQNLVPLELTATCQIEAHTIGAGGSESTSESLPRFRMLAYTGGAMRVGGWRYPVVVDLAGLAIPSQNRPIRFGHDPASGVGHTDAISVQDGQLIATGVVSRDTPAAREIVVSGKRGFPWQASIGANVEQFEFIREGQKASANGKEFEGPINIVRQSILGEISFVDLGADGNTSATVAAKATEESNMQSNGNNEQNQTQEQQTRQQQQAPEQVAAVTATQENANSIEAAVDPVVQMRASALAESQRIAAIRKHCHSGQYWQIEAKAIAEGWDATKTELEVLRASRPKAPLAYSVSAPGLDTATLEAACFLSAGLARPERHCQEQALEAASRRYRHGISLQELFLDAAAANGYVGRTFRSDPHTILRMAFASTDQIEAGFSSIDIGGILSNVANKFLLEGFFSVERTWRNICAIRNVSDFKTVTSYRLIGTDQYEQVAPGGELKHGTLGNETYTNKADTYGLMLGIDRRDIINDDLGAITTVPRKLGRGSGLKINDVFWRTFMNNSAFFSAGNKNLVTGTDTALGIDGLSKAEVAFNEQVDADGKPIGILPQVLLVPTALSALALQLNKSMELRDNTASAKYPIANPHVGRFRPETSRYLSNSQFTGNSAKAWYLLADAADLPVIEVAFLNGNESPTIESAEANFNQLGVQMRGYHDFGVALQDARGGVKAKGEA